MAHDRVLEILRREKIIAILRGIPGGRVAGTAKALLEGGIRCLEVAFDHTSKEGIRDTLQSIRLLRDQSEPGLLIGAGTVLTPEEVVLAREAGAQYIISPDMNPEVIRLTRSLDLVSIPGAYSPTEAVAAHRAGADIVKLFPAGLLGPEYFRAVMGPLGHIPFSAVGNIDASNLYEFLEAGVTSFGIGGSMVDQEAVREGNFKKLTETARKLTGEMERFRREKGGAAG